MRRLAAVAATLVLAGCMHHNQRFESAVTACAGQPLECFHRAFGPTEGRLLAEPAQPGVYRFNYFFRELYGDCYGNVVLDQATGAVARGYLDGPGCRYD